VLAALAIRQALANIPRCDRLALRKTPPSAQQHKKLAAILRTNLKRSMAIHSSDHMYMAEAEQINRTLNVIVSSKDNYIYALYCQKYILLRRLI
jgi:hypothetical protein